MRGSKGTKGACWSWRTNVGTEDERMTSAGTLYEKRLSARPAVVVSLTKIHRGEEDPDDVEDAEGDANEEDDDDDEEDGGGVGPERTKEVVVTEGVEDVLETEEERDEALAFLGLTVDASSGLLVHACGGGGTSSSIASRGRSKRTARSSVGKSRSVLMSNGESRGQ